MRRALVLGGGMVGSAMVHDLTQRGGLDEVTVADVDPKNLARIAAKTGAKTIQADLSNPREVARLAETANVVLGALPSRFGLQTLQAMIETAVPYCDISFMPEDPLLFHERAAATGARAVVDCGVAPGMSNLLIGWALSRLDKVTKVSVYVGGLPEVRSWPWQYKATFSPYDVIEEYLRPARQVEGGKIVIHEALSGSEMLEFPGIGTLEAFHTDGLRSLVRTIDVPDIQEKTLRYPGHIELMKAMRHLGLFGGDPIQCKGQTVIPREVTSALLFPQWSFEEGERDVTVMRIETFGIKDGTPQTLRWDLCDRYHTESNFRSMPRTTAFPCTIMARLLLDGKITATGVLPPEIPGQQPGIAQHVLAELWDRGIQFVETTIPG